MKNEWIPIGFLPLWIAFHVFMYRRTDLTRAHWDIVAEGDPTLARRTRFWIVVVGVIGVIFMLAVLIRGGSS